MYIYMYCCTWCKACHFYAHGVLLQAGYRSAVVCVTLLDRLNGDQVGPFHYTTDSLCLCIYMATDSLWLTCICTCTDGQWSTLTGACTCHVATDNLWSTCTWNSHCPGIAGLSAPPWLFFMHMQYGHLIICGTCTVHTYMYNMATDSLWSTCIYNVYVPYIYQCTCNLATDTLWSTWNEATDINLDLSVHTYMYMYVNTCNVYVHVNVCTCMYVLASLPLTIHTCMVYMLDWWFELSLLSCLSSSVVEHHA